MVVSRQKYKGREERRAGNGVRKRKSIKNITVNKMAYDILCHQAKRDKNVLTGWPGKITSFVGIPIEVVEA